MKRDRKTAVPHGGESYLYKPRDIIDFSSSINPSPPYLPLLTGAIIKKLKKYPDPGSTVLRKRLSRKINVSYENILLTPGGSAAIHTLAEHLALKRILILAPSYGEYEDAFDARGAACSFHVSPDKDTLRFGNFLEDKFFLKKIKKVDGMILGRPNNPTGEQFSDMFITALIKTFHKMNKTLIIDEAFVDFTAPLSKISIKKNVFFLRSFTKTYGYPGLRLGMIIAGKKNINNIRNLQPFWPVDRFTTICAEHLIKNSNTRLFQNRSTKLRKEFISDIKKISFLEPVPSDTFFFICRITSGKITSELLKQRLIKEGILIRNCDSFRGIPGGKYIRISARTGKENHKLIDALKKIKSL